MPKRKNLIQLVKQVKKEKKTQEKHVEVQQKQKQETKRRIVCPYSMEHKILLVGEGLFFIFTYIGNFSFANALALLLSTGENILATCYDTQEVVEEKYPDAAEQVTDFVELGGNVVYGIDATQMHKIKTLKGKKFSHIVFNFPHGLFV